ncbi:uncharacterized protein [Haliotis asinina]|uniref:uncharacterized protein n=1 Tax=Haliotis asinina TaxID=109174 RepID=UPI003531F1D4
MEHPTLAILVVILTLGLARCQEDSRILLDIVEPTGADDVETKMATINSLLKETASVDFIFKVAGAPRVLAILNIPRLCNVRPLEEKLLAANLDITVKSLLLGEKLAALLDVNKTLISSAPPATELTGDYIYLWDAVFRMEGLNSEEYKQELRDNLEDSLKFRLANHQTLMYRVLGGFPIQMMYFVPMKPEDAELVVWGFNRRKLVYTVNVVLVQHMEAYLNGCQ